MLLALFVLLALGAGGWFGYVLGRALGFTDGWHTADAELSRRFHLPPHTPGLVE